MYKAGSLVRGIIPDLCCPENSLTGRFASHISLLSAISCPIAQEPTRDDGIWAPQPGGGLAVPKRSWQAALTACCQPQGLLTACSHRSQCSHHLSHHCRETKCCPFTPREQQGNWVTLGSPGEVSPAAIFTVQENTLVPS